MKELLNIKNNEKPISRNIEFQDGFIPSFQLDGDGWYTFYLHDKNSAVFSEKPLAVISAEPKTINEKKYLSLYIPTVEEEYQNKGIATNMYRYIMENMPEGYSGIYSHAESRASEFTPRIYETLSKEYKLSKDEGDNYFLTKFD